MRAKLTSLSILILILFTSSKSFCQAETNIMKPALPVLKIEGGIELTGKLDNPIWAKANSIELKYEITPKDNTPAPQRTIVKALYDDKYIYFGFECFDTNPEEIRANISDRDKMYQDDWVFVALDTYGDFQRSYEFCVNPYGIMGDLLATNNSEDASVDWIWHAAASRNENGWTAEMKIPFSSLHFPNAEMQNFKANILRTLPRSSRIQVSWMPVDRNIPGFMNQAGDLIGITNIQSGSSVELLPYAIGQQTGSRSIIGNPHSDFKYDSFQGRVGGGIKYSPSPNFSLDAVINPDFSQIETDAAQISVNTTYALNYSEKRPFFLIGRELLQNSMYYSRSINNPLAASRIIGKSGGLSYLYMNAYDRNTVFVVPGEERSNTVATDLKSVVNIGRLRYDLGNESYIGGMILTKNLSGANNYVFGFDWNYRFWSNWDFRGQGYASKTKELDDTNLFNSSRKFSNSGYDAAFNGEEYWGTGINMFVSHSARNYNFHLGYNDFSPTYQTYNGLFSSNGKRQISMGHMAVFYPENSFINNAEIGFSSYLMFNYEGIKKEQVIEPYLFTSLKGPINLRVSYLLVNDEQFAGKYFDGINRARINLSSNPINQLSFSAFAEVGEFIYRSSSPRMGKGHNFSANVTLKPTSQFNISLSYTRAGLSDRETGQLYYDGNIYRGVAIYQFTPQMLFRTILQYDSFAQSFQFYPLFSYKLSAFTTFYAGATSDYIDYKGDVGFSNTNQQYFIKFQYLISF